MGPLGRRQAVGDRVALCVQALVSARCAVRREVGASGCCAPVSRAGRAPSYARTVPSAGRVRFTASHGSQNPHG